MSLLKELTRARAPQGEIATVDHGVKDLIELQVEVNETSEEIDDLIEANGQIQDAVVALESLVEAIEANGDLSRTSYNLAVARANRILRSIEAEEIVCVSLEAEDQSPADRTSTLKNAVVERIKKITAAAKSSATKVLDELTGFWDKIGNSAEGAGKRAAFLQGELEKTNLTEFKFELANKYVPALEPEKLTAAIKADTDKIFNEYGRGLTDALERIAAGNQLEFRFKTIQPNPALPGKPHFVLVGSAAKLEWEIPKSDEKAQFSVSKEELIQALANVRAVMGAILKFKEYLRTFPKDFMSAVEKLGNSDDAEKTQEARRQLDMVARIMNYTVKRWTTYAGTQATLVLKVASTAAQQKSDSNEREVKDSQG